MDMQIADTESSPSRPHVDGRKLRSARTRRKIIAAVQAHAAEGILNPRVRDIAGRAGVSTRSIFQHFDDVAELRRAALTDADYAAEAARLRALPDRELVEAKLSGMGHGPRPRRLA